jgi:hypothetical protein
MYFRTEIVDLNLKINGFVLLKKHFIYFKFQMQNYIIWIKKKSRIKMKKKVFL